MTRDNLFSNYTIPVMGMGACGYTLLFLYTVYGFVPWPRLTHTSRGGVRINIHRETEERGAAKQRPQFIGQRQFS